MAKKNMSPEEYERLIEATRDRDYRLIWQLMACCGLRSVEVTNLTHNDIDLELRLIHVGNTSSNSDKSRTIIYPECLQKEMSELIKRRNSSRWSHRYLFISYWYWYDGFPLSTRAIRQAFKRYSEIAGIEGYSPHSLRHFYAESMVRKGVDLNTIRQNLGVSTLSI